MTHHEAIRGRAAGCAIATEFAASGAGADTMNAVLFPSKRSLARPLRLDFTGAWHHVMNRGSGRRAVFRRSVHRTIFLALLREISETFAIQVHAYCLMDNHYHLLVHTPQAGLSRAMRHLNSVYTQAFNRTCQVDGPLFRGRYRSVLVDADSYLLQVSRYIHLNPVTARLVPSPGDYPYSSYEAYVGSRTRPDWLHVDRVLSHFGGGAAPSRYRRFVEEGIDDETRGFYEKPRLAPVFGSEVFKEGMESSIQGSPAVSDPEVPDARRVVDPPDLGRVSRAISAAFGVDEWLFRRPRASRLRRESQARAAAALLARSQAGFALKVIADWLGYDTYSAVSLAIARTRESAKRNRELGARIDMARRLILRPREFRGVADDEG